MFLSGEDPAAIESFKEALWIESVNAQLLAAQKAAERQAERNARGESWMSSFRARHFSKRPVSVMKAFGTVAPVASAHFKWAADSPFATGVGSFTDNLFELWRAALFEATSQAADKGVFPIGLPPVEALARSLADSTASKEVRENSAVVMVTENVLQQDKAIMAAVAVKAREFSVDESFLTKTASRASSSVSVLLSAIKNAERTADPAESLTPLLLQFLRAYVPAQQVLTHKTVV